MGYKLGINVQGGTGGLSVPEHIALIKEVGWDGFFTSWDPSRTEAWATAGAQSGLIYTSIHAPFSQEHRIWIGGEEGEAEANRLIACAEDCARFDIPVMVLHTINGFSARTPSAPTESGLKLYARIIEVAERCGTKLAFENTEREEFLHAVMNAFGHLSCVGFCFDSGHEHCYHNSDLLTRYGKKLCHTHLDDNFGVTGIGATNKANEIDGAITWYDDSHLPPFDGSVDFSSAMRRIQACGYDGVLTFELSMKHKPERSTHKAYTDMTPEEFYRLTLERARRVRDLAL